MCEFNTDHPCFNDTTPDEPLPGINFCDDNPMNLARLDGLLDCLGADDASPDLETTVAVQAEIIDDLEDQLRQVKADYGKRYAEVLDHVMALSIQADERDAEIFRLEAEVATLHSFLPAGVRAFLANAKANAAANNETGNFTLPPSYDRDSSYDRDLYL